MRMVEHLPRNFSEKSGSITRSLANFCNFISENFNDNIIYNNRIKINQQKRLLT